MQAVRAARRAAHALFDLRTDCAGRRRRSPRGSARAARNHRVAARQLGDLRPRAAALAWCASSSVERRLASSRRHRAANRRFTPASLNWLAMVGNTGICVVFHALLRMVAPPLLAHVAQRILGAALLELVDHDQVGEVEHVDLLELARGAVLARHHVDREVDQIDDLGVALADAGRLDHDQVEPGELEQRDRVGEHGAGGEMLAARRERAHEDALVRQAVHADAVAEQRATRCGGASGPSPPRRSGGPGNGARSD